LTSIQKSYDPCGDRVAGAPQPHRLSRGRSATLSVSPTSSSPMSQGRRGAQRRGDGRRVRNAHALRGARAEARRRCRTKRRETE